MDFDKYPMNAEKRFVEDQVRKGRQKFNGLPSKFPNSERISHLGPGVQRATGRRAKGDGPSTEQFAAAKATND
jgi:hypothetical protein